MSASGYCFKITTLRRRQLKVPYLTLLSTFRTLTLRISIIQVYHISCGTSDMARLDTEVIDNAIGSKSVLFHSLSRQFAYPLLNHAITLSHRTCA